LPHDRGEELVRDLVLQQARAVLRERGRIERRLIDPHVEQPLEQQLVVQRLAERTLRADRVHRHHHRRLQQRLRRHTRPAHPHAKREHPQVLALIRPDATFLSARVAATSHTGTAVTITLLR
jgi:hypothetical protein